MTTEKKEQEIKNVIVIPKGMMPWDYLPELDEEDPAGDETPDSIEEMIFRYEK